MYKIYKHYYRTYHCKHHITTVLVQTGTDTDPNVTGGDIWHHRRFVTHSGGDRFKRHHRQVVLRTDGDASSLLLFSYLSVPIISLAPPLF